MGNGRFDSGAAAARAAFRATTGTSAFTHQQAVSAGRAKPLHATQDLLLKGLRESRDFPGKNPSFPNLIICDTTGSMSDVPEFLVKQLAGLGKAVLATGINFDPQYAFGVIGDGPLGDPVAVALGEFEADDLLIEQTLGNMFLNNNGFGNGMESYELGLYAAGYLTQTDSFEKRGRKGALILIGDEAPYPSLTPANARRFLGVKLERELSTGEIVQKVMERWEPYILRPSGTMHKDDPKVISAWTNLFGRERVIPVEDWENLVPLCASLICGTAGVSDSVRRQALKTAGFDPARVSTVTSLVPSGPAGSNPQALTIPGSAATRPAVMKL